MWCKDILYKSKYRMRDTNSHPDWNHILPWGVMVSFEESVGIGRLLFDNVLNDFQVSIKKIIDQSMNI